MTLYGTPLYDPLCDPLYVTPSMRPHLCDPCVPCCPARIYECVCPPMRPHLCDSLYATPSMREADEPARIILTALSRGLDEDGGPGHLDALARTWLSLERGSLLT